MLNSLLIAVLNRLYVDTTNLLLDQKSCNMEGIPLKRIKLEDPENDEVDVKKCIICQENTNVKLSGTSNGQQRITYAAGIRNDKVSERVKKVAEADIMYHMTNECYKQYTMKSSLDVLLKQQSNSDETKDFSFCNDKPSTRSSSDKFHQAPSHDANIYSQQCVICNTAKHAGTYNKCRISEDERASKFLDATVYFQDKVYIRTCDIQSISGVYGADVYCHKNCIRSYLQQHKRALEKEGDNEHQQSKKMEAFQTVVQEIDSRLRQGTGYALTDLRKRCNEVVNDKEHATFTNREVKVLLVHRYNEDSVSFSIPQEANKSAMVYLSSFSKNELVDSIRAHEPLQECAEAIRNELLAYDFALDDTFCDSKDLEESWNKTEIPPSTQKFLSILLNCCEKQDHASDHTSSSPSKLRRLMSIFQIMFFIVHNGHRKTPLHMMNGEAIHSVCKSATVIRSLNRFGLSVSYDELLRFHNDMAAFMVEESGENVPLPSHFDPNKYTIGAFDNFDHEEATMSGIGGTHDTVSVLMQDKPDSTRKKPNISDTNVDHRCKQFTSELPCQKQRVYIKPSKKPEVPQYLGDNDIVFDDNLSAIKMKDLLWCIARLDLSDIDNIKPTCEDQQMPSWQAFNSLITDEAVPEKIVGFLPVIPHPVTEYATVYTALKNFQNILSQLKQTHIAITADEGVYHIAQEIKMQHPDEFQNVILCLGSFHMIKIVLACIGKYLEDSGAETIWLENGIFGPNVIKSVLGGTHYVRSLKGMLLLCETIERLQLCEFLHETDHQYEQILESVRDLKTSVAAKDRPGCKTLLESFANSSTEMQDKFQEFKSAKCEKSETFGYWNKFVHMVYLVRNLIRADREGDWNLHLQSVHAVLPLFAVCDRTNYIRWASMYLEEMLKLPDTAPEVYNNFLEGKFVVKQTPGMFNAVGADMCLEQTINRSQKSSAGIIGSTKRKEYVAQWELIHHEMMAVGHTYRKLSGIELCHSEVAPQSVHHDFRKGEIDATESNIGDMISYIMSHENPTVVLPTTECRLHHILTQEIVTNEIKESLLNMYDAGKKLYAEFRRERFVEKSKKLTDTIHRHNMKSFKNLHSNMKPEDIKRTDPKKELAKAQKVIDIARVREYDMKHLFTYDLVSTSYLFDAKGFMSNPQKSLLCTELEKSLAPDDYINPKQWEKFESAFMIDVMSNIRRIPTTKLKTFQDFLDTFVARIIVLCPDAQRIDFVFDSYCEGSIKDSERSSRCSHKPIEINELTLQTQLPKEMDHFWSSSRNKQKLQLLLKDYISQQVVMQLMEGVLVVLSGTEVDGEITPCIAVLDETVITLHELHSNIEEADVRLIPHAVHATQSDFNINRIVVLSNDTDVIVLHIYFWNMLHNQGLKELWVKAGLGDTTRYIPIHTLANKLGQDLCKVLPAVHNLTGSDYTSKFGTKAASLKANPTELLQGFGKDPNSPDLRHLMEKAETFLAHVYKRGNHGINKMDDMRYHLYHHSGSTLLDLPPTSFATNGHILRAFYATYMQISCLEYIQVDPREFGFEDSDGLLLPSSFGRLVPEDLPQCCSCTKCATRRCICRDNNVSCCIYCKCQAATSIQCKNPNVVLRVPVVVPPSLENII